MAATPGSQFRHRFRSLSRTLAAVAACLCWALVNSPATRAQASPPAADTSASAPALEAATAPSPIATDRPSFTDSSVVVPAGSLQFENGITETSARAQQIYDFPATLVRFGLTSKTELRFTAPDYFHDFHSGALSGWDDLSLGLKQQLVTTSGGFDASLVAALSFPTGSNAFSSHGYDPQLLVPWSNPISKNWTAAGMLAVLWLTQNGRHNATGQFTFLVDRQLTHPWDAFVEYGGEYPQRGGPQHLIHFGTSFKITPRQQLDFHVGFGLSAAAVHHLVGAGYSVRF